MLLIYILIIYMNIWLIFSISFYGFAQIITALISVFFLMLVPTKKNAFANKNINILLILPLMLLISNIGSFFVYVEPSFIARAIYTATPLVLFLCVQRLKLKNIGKVFNFFLYLYIVTNLIALFYFTKFSVAHSKFIPAVDWAFMTSNNISYHTTLLGFFLLIFSYKIKKSLKLTFLVVFLFTIIHFSKSHIAFLMISLILSGLIISKLKIKLSIVFIFSIILSIFKNLDIENIVIQMNIKPLSRIYYGLSELPYLIEANGWQEGLIIAVSDIGDETRADIYLNGINNLWKIGFFGSDPDLHNLVFNGRDYHNTLLYFAYEYGLIGLLFYFVFISTIFMLSLSIKQRFIKFLLLSAFFYFIFRSFFISIDIVWITIYWFFILYISNIGDYYGTSRF
ncbi:hypothetical protein [Psychrobacter sp. DWR1-2-3]|uniref:hypothetical protein n=1 Tax=Psychrobacter sp. DWR1-2-3 TaxID=2804637 RepID=UPI003CE717D4